MKDKYTEINSLLSQQKRDIYDIIAPVHREQYKMLQKTQNNGKYRPVCKKLCKILFPQVCLHRIIQGINPRLILKYLNIVSYV